MTPRRHPRAGLLLVLAVSLGGGCDSAAPGVVPVASERGPGVPTDVQGPTETVAPGAAAQDPNRPHHAPPSHNPGSQIVPGVGGPAVPSSAPIGEPTTAPAQGPDYANALRSAFGTPTDCISAGTREHLQGQLVVNVSVRVTPSGRVTSANVSANGLSGEDLDCLTRRAEALRLSGAIEGAPRTVSTSITYQVAGTPSTGREGGWELDWGPSSPQQGTLPPGAQAPGIVTPAHGPNPGPAPGSVRPDSTLPAQGSTVHPPGYVPPDSTLPAVAP